MLWVQRTTEPITFSPRKLLRSCSRFQSSLQHSLHGQKYSASKVSLPGTFKTPTRSTNQPEWLKHPLFLQHYSRKRVTVCHHEVLSPYLVTLKSVKGSMLFNCPLTWVSQGASSLRSSWTALSLALCRLSPETTPRIMRTCKPLHHYKVAVRGGWMRNNLWKTNNSH